MNTLTLKQAREVRSLNARAARDLLDKTPGKLWNPAAQAAYDAHVAVLNKMDGEIAVLERQREGLVDQRVQDAIDTAYAERRTPRDPLTDAWLRRGNAGLTDEQHRAIRATLSTTTGSQGGFTVPSLVADRFADYMKDAGGLRRVAEVIRTPTGNVFGYPTSDGTAEYGERLAENQAVSSLDPSFGTVSLNTNKYGSKIITAPIELVQDAAFDFETYVLTRFATRIARTSNQDFTLGAGNVGGFVTGAGLGKVGTTGQTLTVIHDDLVDLMHSVDPGYRALPGCAFMMSDSAFKIVLKLKDSQNRPLYLPDDSGEGDTLLGYPVIINPEVPVMAANAKSIFFGNWTTCYKVRDALDIVLYRFDDSVYTAKGQVGFLAIARIGGNLVDTNGVRYYANSARNSNGFSRE